jgi:hypothetical protein
VEFDPITLHNRFQTAIFPSHGNRRNERFPTS